MNWRGLYVPKGISDEAYTNWANALEAVGDSPEWAEAMDANGLAPFKVVGADFEGYLANVIQEVQTLSKEIGVIQ